MARSLPPLLLGLTDAVGLQWGGMVVDEELAPPHLDAVAGNSTTRSTQACERSPVQRNTTTSPRFGVSPNRRSDFGSVIWIGNEAAP